MKFLYIFLFFTLISCNTIKKEYICGDRPCVDKKEFNEYFSKNLTIEIASQNEKESKNINLIKLNTKNKKIKKLDSAIIKNEEKLRKKKEKEKLKAERLELKNERKIRKKQKQNDEKKKKQLATISKSDQNKNQVIKSEILNDRVSTKKNLRKKINKEVNIKEEETYMETTENITTIENTKSVCNEIKDCDINKIAEMLIEKGKLKPFPDITSN
jgi:hypothetical protein